MKKYRCPCCNVALDEVNLVPLDVGSHWYDFSKGKYTCSKCGAVLVYSEDILRKMLITAGIIMLLAWNELYGLDDITLKSLLGLALAGSIAWLLYAINSRQFVAIKWPPD